MDYFSICLNSLCIIGQGILHIRFSGQLTGKGEKGWHIGLYLLLLGVLEWWFVLPGMAAVGGMLLVLYGMNRLALGNQRSVSWAASILAVYISQLSFGITNSVEAVLFPRWIGSTWLYLLLLLATAAAFAICAGCYMAVLKFLPLKDYGQMPLLGLLLLPGLFFFAAELYILHSAYSQLDSSMSLAQSGKHAALLLLQVLGLAALLCTLYAYGCICRGFQAQAALGSLTQAVNAQKTYIAQAQMRYEQTRAFRHDIRNHLSVLSGLLNSGRPEECRAYLEKLDLTSAALSFPCPTGNPVVDILLSEKLELAKASGIVTETCLILPDPCGIDDFDLCVIFANALDNALAACQEVTGPTFIRIAGQGQGDFYMLEFVNTCLDTPQPPMGTGLSNIQTVARQYHGTMMTEKAGDRFCLSVLLNISLPPDAGQKGPC